jgi:asparagine synthase (glutamine-hydrolysing)
MSNPREETGTSDGPSGDSPGPEGWTENLAQGLGSAIRTTLSGVSDAGVAFSGGIDSSLVAMLAAKHLRSMTLYTVGLTGAKDLAASERAAEQMELGDRLHMLVVHEEEVLEAARSVRELLPLSSKVEISFLVPLYIVCSHATEKNILTGEGADELFGGYSRYTRMDAAGLAGALSTDTEQLLAHGIQRNQLIARSMGKTLVTPFLANDLVELALAIPPELRVARGERKLVLKRAALKLGLHPEIVNAPKRAAQYGSSVMKVLRKEFKMN